MERRSPAPGAELAEYDLRVVLDAAPDAVVVTDPHGTLRYCNPKAVQRLGYSAPADLVGRPIGDLIAPEAHARALQFLEETLVRGELRDAELTLVRRDGTRYSVEASVGVLRGPDGAPRALFSFTRDISRRKQAEAVLRESEERYRTLFSHAAEGVFLMSLDGTTCLYNEAFARMHGYASPEEMARIGLAELDTPETARLAPERLRRLMAGESMTFEVEHRHRDGHVFPLSVSCNVIHIEGVPHYLGFHRDLTERRRAEEEKAELVRQLHQAQKLEAIGRLAGGVAHDFNNILAVILGTAEQVAHGLPTSDPIQRHLERITRVAKRARDLTLHLLTFARREQLAVRPTRTSTLVQELVDLLQRSLPKDIAIVADGDVGGASVTVDPSQVIQALLNLCINAADAMPAGGTLTLRCDTEILGRRECEPLPGLVPGRYGRIVVEDTGEGMSEAIREHIFDPFFTTKERGKGTGLGLPIALGIVQSHRGTIAVDSAPGRGTRIAVYLPATDEATPVPDASPPPLQPRARGERVLVVDDDRDILETMTEILGEHGFEVLPAIGPPMALELFRRHGPAVDLVVLDLMMPEMGGDEVFRLLRRMRADVRILLCSGYSTDGKAGQLLREGAQGFLQKPFDRDQLLRAVSAALR